MQAYNDLAKKHNCNTFMIFYNKNYIAPVTIRYADGENNMVMQGMM